MIRRPPRSTLFPYNDALPISPPEWSECHPVTGHYLEPVERDQGGGLDRKSTRLNSSHGYISYSFFFFFNDTATTEIYTLSLQRRSSDLTARVVGMSSCYRALSRTG